MGKCRWPPLRPPVSWQGLYCCGQPKKGAILAQSNRSHLANCRTRRTYATPLTKTIRIFLITDLKKTAETILFKEDRKYYTTVRYRTTKKIKVGTFPSLKYMDIHIGQ